MATVGGRPEKETPKGLLRQINKLANDIKLISKTISENAKIIINGSLIKDIDVTTTSLVVNHNLGRNWKGFIITRRSAAQHVYEGSGSTYDKSKGLGLISDGAVTVDVWIF